MSVKSWFSPEVSTVISARRPSGSRRVPSESALVEPRRVEQRIGLVDVVVGIGLGKFRLVERALRQHRVAALARQAEEHHVVDVVPVDAERQRAAEADVAVAARATPGPWR